MAIGVYRQVELIEPESEALLVCWVPAHELVGLGVGTRVELKGVEGRIWTIQHIYKTTVNELDVKKNWGLKLE